MPVYGSLISLLFASLPQQYKGQTVEHLEEFAHEGLRTLCIGVRSLSESEFQSWFARFTQVRRWVVG